MFHLLLMKTQVILKQGKDYQNKVCFLIQFRPLFAVDFMQFFALFYNSMQFFAILCIFAILCNCYNSVQFFYSSHFFAFFCNFCNFFIFCNFLTKTMFWNSSENHLILDLSELVPTTKPNLDPESTPGITEPGKTIDQVSVVCWTLRDRVCQILSSLN